jgi:hypothetical protein
MFRFSKNHHQGVTELYFSKTILKKPYIGFFKKTCILLVVRHWLLRMHGEPRIK